jgi:hypothetical protein
MARRSQRFCGLSEPQGLPGTLRSRENASSGLPGASHGLQLEPGSHGSPKLVWSSRNSENEAGSEPCGPARDFPPNGHLRSNPR